MDICECFLMTVSAFDLCQWYDALRSMARLPFGIPPEFRRKMWLSLADWHIKRLKVDWQKTVRTAFNDRTNPDDDKLGSQIVKVRYNIIILYLHR